MLCTRLLSVPPMAVTSARVKSALASLRVKVTRPVWPGVSTACAVDRAIVGAVVSMTTVNGAAGLTWPEGLVTVTARLLTPSGSGAVGVTFQEPSGATVAEPTTLPCGSVTLMTSPGVPVPDTVGVGSVVRLSVPEPVLLPGAMAMPVGATGGVVVPKLKFSVLLVSVPSAFWLPAASANLALSTRTLAVVAPAAGVKVAV